MAQNRRFFERRWSHAYSPASGGACRRPRAARRRQRPPPSSPYRTLDDKFAPPAPDVARGVEGRARRTCASTSWRTAGPAADAREDAAQPASSSASVAHADYIVSKVYFESLPGLLRDRQSVSARSARAVPRDPLAARPLGVRAAREHRRSRRCPGRAINLARQGFVVFTYDMIGYNDSRQLPHTFGGQRESLWGLSLAGLQLWNSIRALDFLETLPLRATATRIGATGASGGGTQTFLLAAVDDRVTVAAPVNMISLHMQGGCLCENLPGLRLDTNNVEIAATIAPRPLLMVSATGDWTHEHAGARVSRRCGSIYALFGARGSRARACGSRRRTTTTATAREAMYAWMARWLQKAPADVQPAGARLHAGSARRTCSSSTGGRCPTARVTPAELTEQLDRGGRAAAAATRSGRRAQRALLHALGFARRRTGSRRPAPRAAARTVHPRRRRRRAGAAAASAARLRRCDRSRSRRSTPRRRRRSGTSTPTTAPPPASASPTSSPPRGPAPARCSSRQGDAALAGAARRGGRAGSARGARRRRLRHVAATRSSSSGSTFPGLRRAGDLQTAAAIAGSRLAIHNAGDTVRAAGARWRRN